MGVTPSTKSTNRQHSFASPSTSNSPNTPDQFREKRENSETVLLFQQGKEIYNENLVRKMLIDSNQKSRANRRKNQVLGSKISKERGFFLKGVKSRKIRVLEVKDLAEILTDSRCPAFRGCAFSIGLRFHGPKKETIISFECRTRSELDRWHRQFRYLKEIKGGVTMPVNVRAGFRMQGDLKWQGSFEEHFEFYCPRYHEMVLHSGEKCHTYRCENCFMKANRDTMFFHVCPYPKCNYAMCTKCAKSTSKIGEGGFSEVHLAINKNMVDRPPCVIKIFKNMIGHSALKKIVMETDMLFKLQAHPNIVKYQGYGGPNENGQLWMVMEYCDGGSVLDLRKGMKTLMAESHIAYIIHCVLRALAFLHSMGIVHKDIKAANILLTTNGFVKLSDFGISETVKNTGSCDFAGSPLWMPPEAYKGQPVNERGDLWSLGVTAIELAEGRPPYFGEPLDNVADKVMHGKPPTLRSKMSLDKEPRRGDLREWSNEFKRFLARCFVKNPEHRPSAEDLIHDPFMDEEQFKLTTFCNRLMDVMQDAGIFEMNNASSKTVEEKSVQVQKNVPALICRKSLLYLIQYKNYKEIHQKDENDIKSDRKGNKELQITSIRNRLFGKASRSITDDGKGDAKASQKGGDITQWDFIRTLQQRDMDTKLKRQRCKESTNADGGGGSSGETRNKLDVVSPIGGAAPMLIVEDDLTKTREQQEVSNNISSGTRIPPLQIGDWHKKKEEQEATNHPVDIPALRLEDDLTLTHGGQHNQEQVSAVNEGPHAQKQLYRESSKNIRQEEIKFDKQTAGGRFIQNSENTFMLGHDGNNRIFSTHNFAIDTSGRMDARETQAATAATAISESHAYEYRRSELIHIRHLGRGASGFVVKSFHMLSRKFVALKHMSIENAGYRHQLDKELTAFVKIQHPQVMKLLGAYLEAQRIVIVLEYMDLGSLEDVVRRRKKINERYIAQMAKQVLEGLRHIHSKRFVHRDIKPENFLVSSTGDVKVADFGLMRQLKQDETGIKTVNGTLWYMSPERVKHEEFAYPADIWAVGITLIFCATGKNPIPQDYWKMHEALVENPPPTLSPEQRFSQHFCEFVDLCLKKDPKKRLSAEQLLKHPFIQNAASREELSTWLCTGEKKSFRHRAKQEMRILACEIHHNRKDSGSDMFLKQEARAKLAEQLRVNSEFVENNISNAWAEAHKVTGGRSFEFWKPDKYEI